jgi:(2Fe-2S) ferredoxin
MSKHSQVEEFTIEGRLLGFVVEDGYQLKYLRLGTGTGEFWFKLSKELRSSLDRGLVAGEWIHVSGEKKLDLKKGKIKLKAYSLTRVAPHSGKQEDALPVNSENASTKSPKATKPKAAILVCQKSDCCKLGAKAVSQAIQEELRDRGLEDQITIKGTGCMKRCKAGPNIVMPDKTRYTRIDSSEISEIIDKHFPAETIAEPLTAQCLACEAVSIH